MPPVLSTITRGDGKSGDLGGILDPLDQSLARGIVTGWFLCAKEIQREVVRRCPIEEGNLREVFSSPDCIAKTERHHWRFGLLTADLQERGFYWVWVEYGTAGHPVLIRTYYNRRTGRRFRRRLRATIGREAHPFVRPGIVAGRARFVGIMSKMLAVASAGVISLQGGGAQAYSQGLAIYLKDIDARINEKER